MNDHTTPSAPSLQYLEQVTQSQGKPLIIETMTARVEVLGTAFTLAAQSEQTCINVAEGRVRMKRLVDGETTEVPQEHSWA